MKEYYVDKFPDSCFNCQFSTEACYCKLNSLMTDTVTFHENFYELKRYKDCPLKLLSDRDKQVRKEVCDKIRMICNRNYNYVGDGTGYDGIDYHEMMGANNMIDKLLLALDKIQGETK